MLHLTPNASFVRRLPFLLIACFVVAFVGVKMAGPKLFIEAHAQNSNGTRLLRTPTVSATQIAFAYARNIWTVSRAGGAARRLTSFARWKMDCFQRRVRRQHGRLRGRH